MRPPASRSPHPAACDLRPSAFSRRLTDLGYRIFALGLVLGLLATLTGSRVLLGAGAFALLLPWLSMLSLPGQRVEVTVDAGPRARVADPMPVRVRVRNSGRVPLPPLELRHVRPLMRSDEGAVDALEPGSSVAWTAGPVPTTRGVSSHGHVEVLATDLFGLSQQRIPVPVAAAVAVGPRAVDLPMPLPVAVGGLPLEPADLRPWRPGYAASSVAWRASARRSAAAGTSLVVRDRVAEEADLARLALGAGPAAEFERALEVLAVAAATMLAAGRRVEVRLGERRLQPARLEVLLDALAVLDAGTVGPPARDAARSTTELTIACRSAAPPVGAGPVWLVDTAGGVVAA